MSELDSVESPRKCARVEGEDTSITGNSDGKGKKGKKGKGNGKGPAQSYNLVLDSVRHEYDEVYSYKFVNADSTPIVYKAGQWGHLLAPGAEMGEGNVRHMSFASAAEEGHYLFTMDVSSKSPYKQLFAAAKPGVKTRVFKIKGEFVIDPIEQQDVVFVAGGIGITPIRSLIKTVISRNLQVSCSLIHIARSSHLYQAELEGHSDLQQLRTNRIGASAALASSVKKQPAAWYYVCGSQRFVDGMILSLQELGIAREKICIENFK